VIKPYDLPRFRKPPLQQRFTITTTCLLRQEGGLWLEERRQLQAAAEFPGLVINLEEIRSAAAVPHAPT
jgi:hypothetical protein